MTRLFTVPTSAVARFWSKVDRKGSDDCWPYKGARFTGRNGEPTYGAFSSGGKSLKAQRVAFSIANGPFDGDSKVCHECDNPICCNPAHLWLGSYGDNNRDRTQKGRQAKGEAVSTAVLSAAQVQAIRADRRPSRTLAAEYGVCKSQINNVRNGDHWRHVQ